MTSKFGFPHKQNPRQVFECKSFIWDAIPENTVGTEEMRQAQDGLHVDHTTKPAGTTGKWNLISGNPGKQNIPLCRDTEVPKVREQSIYRSTPISHWLKGTLRES